MSIHLSPSIPSKADLESKIRSRREMKAKESLEKHIVEGYIQQDKRPFKPNGLNVEKKHSRVQQTWLSRQPKIDHRSGIHNLKKIIFQLRVFYKDGDQIPRVDLTDAIHDICGIDSRTERRYEKLLLRRHYLEPAGPLVARKTTRVNVRTYSHIDSSPQDNLKEYITDRGARVFKFGLFAPKPTVQTEIPPVTPPSTFNERSINMGNMCVSQGAEDSQVENGASKDRKKKKVLSHTHIVQHSVNTFEQKSRHKIDKNVSKPSAKRDS